MTTLLDTANITHTIIAMTTTASALLYGNEDDDTEDDDDNDSEEEKDTIYVNGWARYSFDYTPEEWSEQLRLDKERKSLMISKDNEYSLIKSVSVNSTKGTLFDNEYELITETLAILTDDIDEIKEQEYSGQERYCIQNENSLQPSDASFGFTQEARVCENCENFDSEDGCYFSNNHPLRDGIVNHLNQYEKLREVPYNPATKCPGFVFAVHQEFNEDHENVVSDIEYDPIVYLTGNTPVTATEMMMSQLPEDICTVEIAQKLLQLSTQVDETVKTKDFIIYHHLEKDFLLIWQEIEKYTEIAVSVTAFMNAHDGGHYSTLTE